TTLILMLILAAIQNLSESVFTFPLATGTSHVKLTANVQQPIAAMTVCLRFHSELTRAQSLFSLATPTDPNALLLYKPSVGVYRVHIKGTSLNIGGQPDITDEWNSVCWTWDSTSGLTAVWVNGKRSARKVLKRGATISGTPSIILGQEQDTYGGGFQENQSFVGDITDVHFWDSVISPCEIRFYMEGNTFAHGNILNWKDLQCTPTGTVHVEKSDFDKLSCY
uniref:C-reactive protein-like n=1 Tax=Centroberyx gerrardi TaxID=166262 RepID=UPI003AAFD6B4